MTPIRIGSSLLELSTGTLSRHGAPVALQAQPARLLALLAARRGEAVTRDEIRTALWPSTAVAFDQSINYCIRQIRIALGPDAVLLETLPREGYRLRCEDPVDTRSTAMRTSALRAAIVAAIVVTAFAAGFGSGVLAREGAVGSFVYVHLRHPDRCPYIRFLIPTHRNS